MKIISHSTKFLSWAVGSDTVLQMFKSKLRGSGVLQMRHVAYSHPNKNLILAFVERWHPETNSFHMPFGEMTITLDDVECLTGLPIVGRPIVPPPRESATRLAAEVATGLGVSEEEAEEAMEGLRGSNIKLAWLQERFQGLMASESQAEVEASARAYMLFTFGCILFPDKTSTRVNLGWLDLVTDMRQVDTYAWGAGVLAYLYRQLG